MPVKFKPRPRKTHEEAAHAVNSVLGYSADIRDPAKDMPVSKVDIVKEDAP